VQGLHRRGINNNLWKYILLFCFRSFGWAL